MNHDDEEPIPARLPWVGNTPWEDPGSLHHPKVRVLGGPGPDDVLGCAGKWDLFDGDTVTEEARRVCASCSFRGWCLETATANYEHGIWAGTSYEYRRALRKDVAA